VILLSGVNFLKVAHDWEMDSFTLFFNFLNSFRLRYGGENKLSWVLSKREMFEVKSYYIVLVPRVSTLFPWSSMYLAQ
jgi:hypothetical protein